MTVLYASGNLAASALSVLGNSIHGFAGWVYQGTLVEADNTDNGCLWEYPVLAKLPQSSAGTHGEIKFDYGQQEVGVSSSADLDHVFLTGQPLCLSC